MSEKSVKEAWETTEKDVKEEVKFLPKSESVIIYPSPAPYSQVVEGRFGNQTVYVVNTNIGNVALNRTQFLKVVAMFHQNGFKTPVKFAK